MSHRRHWTEDLRKNIISSFIEVPRHKIYTINSMLELYDPFSAGIGNRGAVFRNPRLFVDEVDLIDPADISWLEGSYYCGTRTKNDGTLANFATHAGIYHKYTAETNDGPIRRPWPPGGVFMEEIEPEKISIIKHEVLNV